MTELTMNTGHSIPQLGYGTYKIAPSDTVHAVTLALEAGYRHIDTAQMYGNEAEVGQAIAQSGIPRSEIFLTTKLNNTNHEADAARSSFAQSLEDLQTDYVDLFLIHWPLPTLYGGDFLSTWKVLEEFYADGRSTSIGVSNFLPEHIDVLLNGSDIVPAVNQIEVHPYFTNEESRRKNAEAGIVTQAWSPLGRGAALGDPVIARIAERIGATPAQVVLAWHIHRGDVVIPKSVTPERIISNMDIFDVPLTEQDYENITALDRGEEGRQGSNPRTMDRL
ncbi:aldo/keto reductase [Flaviflexus salsibiostraticola]|uniref:Aldo/keto reductase n=1 Tax=Flaviflexus salsibiostraticola TaxID=1282737 RepID=A0A3S8ZA15_9ACTO|nr:aldo/keto reductase [Flaviflexus salsibiostraticola]AZN30316.1 aldo/keto reductase [Flaviflexus salsibiostraticola]